MALKVLVFGGNGMIVKPYVTQYYCNRDYQPECAANKDAVDCDINALNQCSELVKHIKETSKFDYVMDFSTFHPKWVHDNMQLLKGKIGLYIYISTDSVYEVCNPKPDWRPTKESDAVRPTGQKEVELLKKADNYGHFKLKAEEALEHYHDLDGLQYVSLRLSDVIGPRDTTQRFWMHQMWIELYDEISKPLQIPTKFAEKKSSLTYVEDVATAIELVIQKGAKVHNEAFNIAMDEEFTLSNILLRIANILDKQNVESELTDEHAYYGYPTVTKGPIDISKAMEMLDFKPTDPEVAFQDTIEFYKKAFIEFPKQRDVIIGDLLDFAITQDKKDGVYKAIDKRLSAAGVVDKRYRKYRRGEVSGLPVVNKDDNKQKDEL